jgi:hypothetical protein
MTYWYGSNIIFPHVSIDTKPDPNKEDDKNKFNAHDNCGGGPLQVLEPP